MRTLLGVRVRRAVAALACASALVGCGSFHGVYDMPLPGGADLGGSPYQLSAHFSDVLDLVPHSGVRVNDVAVGRVERIQLASDGRTAEVTMLVNSSVRLAGNAVARLRQSSVLGEKFVELADPPGGQAAGTLTDGAVIGVDRTNRNTEIEEVFGALSLLLNGGGIGQMQDIMREINAALSGNSSEIRSLLNNLDEFVGALDEHRDEIVRAIDGMETLSDSLAKRKDTIGETIDGMGPGVQVLADQRQRFVDLLTSLDALSGVAVDTVNRSKDNLVADLRALEPTLRNLTKAGKKLPEAMEMLFTFPFPDSVLDAVKGDYLNTHLTLRANTSGGGR